MASTEHVPSFAELEYDTPLYRTADRPVRPGRSVRGRRPGRGGAAPASRAVDPRLLPDQARRRNPRRLPRLPRAALERARPDEGRHPVRPRGLARRVRCARRLDDVEVRAPAAALRRREGRRPLQPARAQPDGARAPHAPLHLGAASVHRPTGGHPGAGHGDERADDGLDDGHVLDAARPRGPGDRDGQADLDRRLRLPARGDGGGGRDGRRARLRAPRLETRRAALRRAGIRERRRDRRPGARRPRRDRRRRLGRLGRRPRPGRARHPDDERVRPGARVARGLGDRRRGSRTRSCSSWSATSSSLLPARTSSTPTTRRASAAG